MKWHVTHPEFVGHQAQRLEHRRSKTQALVADLEHCDQQLNQFVQNDNEILYEWLQLRLLDLEQCFLHFTLNVPFADARRNFATLQVLAQVDEAIQKCAQRVGRGDGVDGHREHRPMIVQPLCAGQLNIGRNKGVVFWRLLDHNGQIEFTNIQFAVVQYWQPLEREQSTYYHSSVYA